MKKNTDQPREQLEARMSDTPAPRQKRGLEALGKRSSTRQDVRALRARKFPSPLSCEVAKDLDTAQRPDRR